MAKAYVSFHPVAIRAPMASSVLGPAVYSAVLDCTSGQAVTPNGLTLDMWRNRDDMVALITADTDCFVAIGLTPDCTLEAASAASSARTFLAAASPAVIFLPYGAKVAAMGIS